MIMAKRKIILILFGLFALLVFRYEFKVNNNEVSAETQQEKLERLKDEITEYESEIQRLQGEADTLSNQIAQYDAQIYLTSLKISQTQEKISLLGGRIDQLEGSLQSLTHAFNNRVVRTYKMARLNQPYLMLLTSQDLSGAVSSFHYIKKIQESDRDLLLRLEQAQDVYVAEKTDQEQLQVELEEQQRVLGSQKAAKSQLLEETKNDERRYQQLLSTARAEFESIQAIIAGRGDETEVGPVSAGERIASVIQGASCNSSGSHLHFIVRGSDGNAQNPFSFLNGNVSYENCSGSSCGSGDGDPFNPSGSWEWPIGSPIKYTQGYGSTWATRNTWVGRIYSFHNGIDINNSSSPNVKAVASGILYQGSYGGSSGCRLRYVRVDHDDSDIDTLYLHINY